jgi:hypothetical protein
MHTVQTALGIKREGEAQQANPAKPHKTIPSPQWNIGVRQTVNTKARRQKLMGSGENKIWVLKHQMVIARDPKVH